MGEVQVCSECECTVLRCDCPDREMGKGTEPYVPKAEVDERIVSKVEQAKADFKAELQPILELLIDAEYNAPPGKERHFARQARDRLAALLSTDSEEG